MLAVFVGELDDSAFASSFKKLWIPRISPVLVRRANVAKEFVVRSRCCRAQSTIGEQFHALAMHTFFITCRAVEYGNGGHHLEKRVSDEFESLVVHGRLFRLGLWRAAGQCPAQSDFRFLIRVRIHLLNSSA